MSFDFDAAVQAPFRMQPGLRRLAEAAPQLSPVGRGSRHLREKIAALSAATPPALLCMPGFDATAALHALARHAAAEHPAHFRWDGERALSTRLGWLVTGESVEPADPAAMAEAGACLRSLPPRWRLAGLLALAFEEDFAIIDGRTAMIPWLVVALPSHWSPQAKVGRHFAQVHAPVADNRTLLAAADSLARLVSAPQRWERFVWTLTPNPNLNAHPAVSTMWRWAAGDADSVASQAWWRTERQTFIPVDGAAVFTIAVETQPLYRAIDSAARASRLHDTLASMSPAVLRYRSLDSVRDALLDWLARRAAG